MRTALQTLCAGIPAPVLTLHYADEVSIASPSVAQELIGYAAEDFRQHMQPPPSDVRRVRLGELKSADGAQRRWVLCGEFLQGGAKAVWAPFATIKTSSYEHWLGGSAAGYCKAPSFKAQGADLSPALKERLAAR